MKELAVLIVPLLALLPGLQYLYLHWRYHPMSKMEYHQWLCNFTGWEYEEISCGLLTWKEKRDGSTSLQVVICRFEE